MRNLTLGLLVLELAVGCTSKSGCSEGGNGQAGIKQNCQKPDFSEAAEVKAFALRAAQCLSLAKKMSCDPDEDFLVGCMSSAGDIDALAYRSQVRELLKNFPAE